jgi:hypothetical protein
MIDLNIAARRPLRASLKTEKKKTILCNACCEESEPDAVNR